MAMPQAPLSLGDSRDGSGTSWVPDESVMAGPMRHGSSWMLMFHWNTFAQFIRTSGDRGDQQFGSVNWLMGMASRNAGGGLFTARAMVSAEPLTVGKCGYPNLVQTGEQCNGAALHDRQHPHDMFMELAADYRRAFTKDLAFQLYGGLSAEPALGPVAFPHRASAMPNPIAPISHHWLDSSHISFGVVTAGVYGRKWKAEGSVFNGREPDDERFGLDLGPLDSYSGRLWLMPTPRLALQISAGHLTEAEQGEHHADDVDRVTASAMYHRIVNNKLWATTIAWGRNAAHGDATSAWLAETSLDASARDTLFGRFEVTGKTNDDLVLHDFPHATYTLTKVQAGYTRWLPWQKARAGVGGSVGVSLLPATLKPAYGSSSPFEFSVFINLRPR